MTTKTHTAVELEEQASRFMLRETAREAACHIEADILYFKEAADGRPATIGDINSNNPHYMDTRKIKMRDVRPNLQDFQLETHGFEYVHYDVPSHHVSDEEAIVSVYYPEMEALVKKITNARMVIVFGHYVRYTPWQEETIQDTGYRGPAKRPHVDVSAEFAPDVLKGQLEKNNKADEIDSVMAGHWQLLNIWRPLKVVQKNPLAVCKAATFPAKDLYILKYDLHFPGGTTYVETSFGKASASNSHEWCYLYEQQPNEVLIFKTADSDESAEARAVTHTSFVAPGTESMPARESIELRCLVAY